MAFRIVNIVLGLLLLSAGIFWHTNSAETATLADLATGAQNRRTDALLGYDEFPSHNFSALPQWERIIHYMQDKEPSFTLCLTDYDACLTDNDRLLSDFINKNKNLPVIERVRATNNYFNQWQYTTDQDNYYLSEYWSTPDEFLQKSGDCEDYAIIKYFVLRHMGVDDSQMRIVTVFDSIRSIGHAVLAFYLTDNDIIILDSLSDGLFEDRMYKHYVPQYSLNETTRWLHTAPLVIETNNRYTIQERPRQSFIINRIESFGDNDKQY